MSESHVIRVAAVQLWSDFDRSPEDNRVHALEMAEKAAARGGLDLIVLPEAISMLCYPDGRPDFSYHDVCEPVPGPTTEALAAIARRYRVNIVCGLIASPTVGDTCQNMTVVIDRSGELVGAYNKLHEPEICRVEQGAGVGEDAPVFDLDFGRIGIMVCWDLISPELASILAAKGAELIVFPHLIGLSPSSRLGIQLRARAVDNGVPIVVAGMRDDGSHSGNENDISPTCTISPDGVVIASSAADTADILIGQIDFQASSANRKHIAKRARDLRYEVYAREYAALSGKGNRTGG